jgi:hypothetical protein
MYLVHIAAVSSLRRGRWCACMPAVRLLLDIDLTQAECALARLVSHTAVLCMAQCGILQEAELSAPAGVRRLGIRHMQLESS